MISNTGSSDVNLRGWKLVSVTGNQTFDFPDYTLKAGSSVKIVSGPDASSGEAALVWTTKHIWNNSDADPAELYDSAGALASTHE